MSKVKSVSDLKNYNEVLQDVSPKSPLFLTKNGKICYAVVDIDDCNRSQAELSLMIELSRVECPKIGNGWVPLDRK